MKVYTRTGDRGSTGLADGARVSKAAPRVAAYGDVDEANAVLGLLLSEPLPEQAAEAVRRAQSLLFDVGASLADPAGRFELPPGVSDAGWLERWIDVMAGELPALRSFILPGGTRSAALAHQARTVCRRAERDVVALQDGGDDVAAVLPFLNRLSDALFVLARWLNRRAGVPDVPWHAGS